MGRIKVSDLLVPVMRQNGEDWAGGRTSTSHNFLPPSLPLLMSRGRGGGWQRGLQGRLASFRHASAKYQVWPASDMLVPNFKSGQLRGRAGSIVESSLPQISFLTH